MPRDIQAFWVVKDRQEDLNTIPKNGVTKSSAQSRISIDLKAYLYVFLEQCTCEGRLIKPFIYQTLQHALLRMSGLEKYRCQHGSLILNCGRRASNWVVPKQLLPQRIGALFAPVP